MVCLALKQTRALHNVYAMIDQQNPRKFTWDWEDWEWYILPNLCGWRKLNPTREVENEHTLELH